ncbi:hypothetical protein B0T10DRAFT_560611 [Thelonectria olida]|uniref:Uncharacterized protein n=1 Tax=Thelonectria olida TaxID=1576542 RepID=A0A9P8WA59_9HYPO|nr:hypothetical protein B0T10DRAFT_560611 [Thelonectria olida]
MGIDSRKAPPLPAPTETETNNTTPTELTADAFNPGDAKSSYSIPEDGTPVTIPTRGHKANRSQTSLLIEYFEGGKPSSGPGGERRPSVRVRLTPSKSRGDHIEVTETKASRKASLTRRIPLNLDQTDGEDGNSMTSYASATEESNVSRNPIDIEIDRSHRRRRPASPLIPSESYQVNASEISAIPSDSFLDGTGAGSTELKSSFSQSKGEELAAGAGAGAAAAVVMDEVKSHKSKTRERVKLSDKPKEKSDRKRRSKSRTSSVSERGPDDVKSTRSRRSSRSHPESTISAADSSVLSSHLTPSHRSVDTHSTRSGVSKSSINNPKLLETVEDAIRRLILPELSALKREQSKRETRDNRRNSFTSTATSVSEATPDRRRSSGQRSDQKDRRNREARHDYGDVSPLSVSRESLDDYNDDVVTPKRSSDLLKAAAVGAAASKGLSLLDDKSQSEDRKHRERRRRRAESSRSRSVGRDRYVDDYEDDVVPAPPMPLMSEINPSELTRTSILSANTDRPHSATEELTPVQNIARGPLSVSATSSPAPSRTPNNFDDTLLTQHANVSHGDLTALPRGEQNYPEYETDDFGRKVPIDQDVPYDDEEDNISDQDDYPEHGYDNSYFATQEVPPPLKYVPYQAGARGLSPIPSVSGYTDGASEHQPRNSRSMHSTSDIYSQLERSPEHPRNSRSTGSLSSLRARDFEHMSPRNSDLDYRNTTYTDDSEFDRVASGQAVRGIGANPNIIHPVLGVESAVASLVDGSMLEQSVLTSGSGYGYNDYRDSQLSYDDQSRVQSSRGVSPEKQFRDNKRDLQETERHATPSARSQKSQNSTQGFTEYDLDEHGRKVPRTKSPTASEAAITAGAVGAAAAALKARQGKQQAPVEEEHAEDEEFKPAGVFRNKSFKERTLEGHEPRNTPAHSVDRLDFDDEQPKMHHSFVPDFNDPMPEFGYVDDARTNPSIAPSNPSVVGERLDGELDDHTLSGRATPTQRSVLGVDNSPSKLSVSPVSARGLDAKDVAAAGAVGAAAAMAATHGHSREPSHDVDEWHRSSEDHKRDTLVTNPYEDASPIVNPALNENLLGARGLNTSYGAPYQAGSPGFTQKYDEGYMSNGPNRTPDVEPKTQAARNLANSKLMAPVAEDPFYVPKDARHLSGMSQGMTSPFYDAATGQGIDRIENKDIVALMQHLMVRDAQRSARDTEIVALLMNAAMEMRTSFNDMRELIQETGDDVIFSGAENTEKLQKAINGPRPYPGGRSSIISNSQVDTLNEASIKKKNLWKRALQGLSAKGTNDLSRIEDMLMQLLGEVDVLKTQTAPPPMSTGRGPSFENLQPEGQYEQDRGYEPEGNSTASHASQSGPLSLSQSRSRLRDERKFSDHRISTVQEHEEEYRYDHPSPSAERTNGDLLTPSRSASNLQRGGSVPLDTPPQPSASGQHPLSAENTPRSAAGKKHKASGSSSWFPKISRWSGTTTSSVSKAFRGSGKKESKYDDYAPSRSGSSLASYNDEDQYQRNPYEEDKLHAGFSEQNLAGTAARQSLEAPAAQRESNFTPDEAPKYSVHRNSLNLQHPQPRPGQTERFRNALESSAQEYDIPMTPRSADWAGSTSSVNRIPQNTNRYSAASSAGAREPEYWATSPTGPPRPPKEPVDAASGTQSPARSSRISKLAKGSPLQQQTDESGFTRYAGSPKPENRNLNAALGVPARRPSGPRAMTPNSLEAAAREERRRKRDTFGSVQSAQTDDTDTF